MGVRLLAKNNLAQSQLPQLLRRHGGTSQTNPSAAIDADEEADQPNETFHPLLSLVDLHGQLTQLAVKSLQQGSGDYDFLTLDRFNSIEKVPFDAFRDIGSGSTFSVKSFTPLWRHSHLDSTLNGTVVAKRIRPALDPEIFKSRLESVKLEILALRDPILATHENIVDLVGFWWENNPSGGCPLPVLLLEQAAFGTLIDLQRRPLTLRYCAKRRLCLDIALGLEALHDASIVHGDLKSENVLIFEHPERGYIAKLSDFGSTVEGGHVTSVDGKRNIVFTREDVRKTSRVSVISFPWNAPEYEYHMKGFQLRLLDVYSFGLLVWRTMLGGRDPFETLNISMEHDRFTAIENLKRDDDFPEMIGESLQATQIIGDLAKDVDIESVNSVIKATVRVDPSKRNLRAAITRLGGEPSRLNLMRHEDEVIDMDAFDRPRSPSRSKDRPRLKRLKALVNSNLTLPIGLDIAVSNWAALTAKASAVADSLSSCAEMYLMGEISGTLRAVVHDAPAILDIVRNVALQYKRLDEIDSTQTQLDELIIPVVHMEILQMSRALGQPLKMDIPVDEIIQDAAGRGFGPALDMLFKEGPGLFHAKALKTWRDRNGGYLFESPADEKWDLSQPEQLKKSLRQAMASTQANSTHISRIVYERLMGHSNFGQSNFDVNKIWVSNDFKYNLLHYAVKSGARSVVEMLLSDFSFDINCRNWLQETPLLVAMRSGHSDIANFLIDEGADCSKRDLFQENALHWICRIDSPNIPSLIKRLTEAACDINAISCKDPANVTDDDESETWDFNILDSDSEQSFGDSGDDDVKEFSIHQYEQLVRTFTSPDTPLHRAVLENNREAVTSLCQSGCDTTVRSSNVSFPLTPFEMAVALHQSEIMSAILPFYLKTEPQDWLQALILAISPIWNRPRMMLHGEYYNSARQSTFGFCLTRLDPAYIRENLPLAMVVSTADSTVLQEFLKGGIYLTIEETIEVLHWQLRPLELALCDGKVESLQVLLEAGAECNFATSDAVGSTNCLHRLAHLGLDDVRFGKLLLQYCDQSLLTMPGGIMTGGTTPFVFAVTQGCFELAKLLLSSGADIDALAVTQISDVFFTGMTALGRLAMQGCDTPLAQLKFLLDGDREKRPEFTVAPATRFTALHAAVLCPRERQSHPETIVNLKFLLSIFNRQEDLDSIDHFGCTALHLAIIWGNYEAVTTLLDAGAGHDIKLYRCLDIRPIDIARARVQDLIESPLGEDLDRGDYAVSLTLQKSMAVVDALDRAITSSTTEASSSGPDSGIPVDPLIENSYNNARGFFVRMLRFCFIWKTTYAPEDVFMEGIIKIIEDTLKYSGTEKINAAVAAEHMGKGKSKAEETDESSYYLPFWWMMIRLPSTEQHIQLAKYLQQHYADRTVVRGEGVLELTIVLKQDPAAETERHKPCLLGFMKPLSPDQPTMITKRCTAQLTALLSKFAMLVQEPTSPSLDSVVEADPRSSLPPELLQELKDKTDVIYVSGESSDEDNEGSAMGFITNTYSSSKQALHSVLKNNRRTQRQLEKVLGPDCMDPID